MPSFFKPENLKFGLGPFNKSPFGLLTAIPNLCAEAGAKNLTFDVRKLPPKQYSFPYHYHRNAEEVMMVISGAMTVRTQQDLKIINSGDIVFFETGETGAHQFFNHTDEPCTYFDVKTIYGLDVVVYPDSGKLMLNKYNEVYDMENGQVDYFRDEENVEQRWEDLKEKASQKSQQK